MEEARILTLEQAQTLHIATQRLNQDLESGENQKDFESIDFSKNIEISNASKDSKLPDH